MTFANKGGASPATRLFRPNDTVFSHYLGIFEMENGRSAILCLNKGAESPTSNGKCHEKYPLFLALLLPESLLNHPLLCPALRLQQV